MLSLGAVVRYPAILAPLTHVRLNNSLRFLHPAIPTDTVKVQLDVRGRVKIDKATIEQLERLSLVNFGNEEGIRTLEDAIAFAEPLKEVDTSGVEPMYTTLENESLRLREDVVSDGNRRREVLANASVVEEDYFVAPPGNIPLKVDAEDKYGR